MHMADEPWDPAWADQWVDAWLAELRRQGASDGAPRRLVVRLAEAAQAGPAAPADPRTARVVRTFLAWLGTRTTVMTPPSQART
jgi:hypothetical protein